MKKFAFALLLVLVAVLFASTAFAGRQDFRLVNNTGKTIVGFWVGPAYNDDWDVDDDKISPWEPLRDGESCTITFNSNRNVRLWDIRADFPDETYTEWHEFDLFKVYEIVLESDGKATYKE